MVTADALEEEKRRYPNASVVCYINSSVKVKAQSNICCTSSNAVDVVRSVKSDEILFVPDQNLAGYVAKKVPEKHIIPWKGFCITHHRHTCDDLLKAKDAHPDALILVHPECRSEVSDQADFVGSTKQIIDYVSASPHKKFIIGTETGVLYSLKKDNPDKEFYIMSSAFICSNMKKTSLMSVYESLAQKRYRIELDEDIGKKARQALDRMLNL
jgi:quinolinate synthase